jgi:hypothetical protein
MKNFYFHLIFSILMLCVLPGSAQVPVYNSLPSAAATIYLDFDGHLVSGTSWNMNGAFQCAPSNLSDDKIREVFNRVAEDYRPFNVNITTDSAKYQQAPAFQRMRVVLTISSQWYGSAGGVSYVGSFNWGDNTPSFVFTALLNYNAKNIAEATAHEIGHTLGLRHQAAYDGNCIKTAEYNAGIGSGEIGWAPIMGVGYYRNFTLWNNGANPYGCTNYQDDLGIITGPANGFGFRPDDHSNQTDQTATATQFINNQFNLSGVIEKISDRDVFRFALPVPGNFHVDALPYNIGSGNLGSNLDMQVELINSSNEVIGIYNPDLLLSSQIDTMLNAGTYFIRVEGKGNQYAPEYASLGSYNLNAVYQPSVVLPVHRIELNGSSENNRHSFNWIIEADEAVAQQVLEVADNGTDFRPTAALTPATRS